MGPAPGSASREDRVRDRGSSRVNGQLLTPAYRGYQGQGRRIILALRSYRVAIRHHCFNLLKARSIKFRCRYSSRLFPKVSHGWTWAVDRLAPFALIDAATRLLSHPLPPMTAPVLIPVSWDGLGYIRPLLINDN